MTPHLQILSASSCGSIDPTFSQNLLNHLRGRVTTTVHADVVVVVISNVANYQFNTALRHVNKPVVVIDLLELYGDEPGLKDTLIFGKDEVLKQGEEWQPFHQWLKENPPALYFKRELFEKDRSANVLPIEWPCVNDAWEIEPKSEFDRRPFTLFFNWGFSNPIRPRLASEIYALMADHKVDVIASFEHIDAKALEPHTKFISIHSLHTHRVPIGEIMRRQAQSKMSVSLPGSGNVCFRSTEAPVHTVPVFLADGMAHAFPWVDMENCIRIYSPHLQTMAEQIYLLRDLPNLHDIYVSAQENIDRYRSSRFANEYVIPEIAKRL